MIKRSGGLAWLALFGVLAAGCGSSRQDPDDEGGSPSTAVPEVTLVKVERKAIADELTASGNLAAPPNRDARIGALVAGRIIEIAVSEGDEVSPGQPLVRIDDAPFREQQRQAEAGVAQAQANVENARLAAQREEDLLGRGIASRKEVENARTQLAVSQAALRQAEASLEAARTVAGRAVLRAPFRGTVVRRFLGVGEQVDGAGNQPVVEVANIDVLELLAAVPASRLSALRLGERFAFQTSAAPGKTFHAAVVAVFPAVDPATNTGTARIRVENPGHDLKLGMYLSISVPMREAGLRLVVPLKAIYPDEGGEPHVYKVTGDQAQAVPVRVGIQGRELAEIISGVAEGDSVILEGGYGLPKTATVRVK